jgi:murein DD-endopeptidase MepM/ murein hydrolase activator NlpD
MAEEKQALHSFLKIGSLVTWASMVIIFSIFLFTLSNSIKTEIASEVFKQTRENIGLIYSHQLSYMLFNEVTEKDKLVKHNVYQAILEKYGIRIFPKSEIAQTNLITMDTIELIRNTYHPIYAFDSRDLTSPFGNRKDPMKGKNVGGPEKGEFHPGNDYYMPVGSRVKAPADAVVEKTGWSSSGGLYVVLRHTMLEKYGIKFETYFYHLSEIEVNKGDLVDKGELVALSGKTGKRQTGAHCHVEARVNDMPVDPKIIYGDPGDWND